VYASQEPCQVKNRAKSARLKSFCVSFCVMPCSKNRHLVDNLLIMR
jgi:hypothetical protein